MDAPILYLDNTHLTVKDFEKIFHPYSAQHLFKKWVNSKAINLLFERQLATNEVLAWERAKAGHLNQIGIVVINTLNLN